MTQTAQRDVADPAATPPAAPPRRKRLVGVDAARGVSLLGMVVLHALYTSDAAGQPTWSQALFSGRAAAAFAVLSGVGIAFASGRRQVRPDAGPGLPALLAVRALVIGAIGLALGEADTVLDSVILTYLALVFLLAIPLVYLPTWAVAAIGAIMVAAPSVLVHLLPQLPAPSLGNPTFGYLFDRPLALLTELSVTGFYPALSWLAYVCAGLVVGRLDLTSARVAVLLCGIGALLAVAASTTSAILLRSFGGLTHIWAAQPGSVLSAAETTELLTFGGNGTTPTSTWWWLATDARHTGTPFDILGTTGTSLALLGVMLAASHLTQPAARRLTAVVLTPLATVGSMTLTFYAAHVLFINSGYDTYDATTGCLVQVVAILLLGVAWGATVGRGPLEGLVVTLATRARRWAAG